MSSGPKIMVFKLREIIYTLILAFFVITLLLCLILMFTKKSSGSTGESQNTETAQSSSDESQTQNSSNETQTQNNSYETQSQNNSYETQSQNNSYEIQTQAGSDLTETASAEANAASSSDSGTYIAGVYTSSVTLGDSAVDVQVTVSSDRILAIELVNLSEATEAAYPLVPSALENIATQILEKQKLDGITCSAQTRYTSQLLLNAVSKALSTALPSASRSTQTQE